VYALLASPASDVRGVRARLDELRKIGGSGKPLRACSSPTVLSWRLRSFVCGTDLYAPRQLSTVVDITQEQLATGATKSSLDDPIVRDQLFDLVKWSSLVSRPYDFWTGKSDDVYTLEELGGGKGEVRGKEVIWGAVSILDIAIAQQVMLSGDLNAAFVYDLTWDRDTGTLPGRPKTIDDKSPVMSQTANKLLRNVNNPWLARNVLMFALSDALRIDQGEPSIPYQDALQPFFEIADAKSPVDEKINAGTLVMRSLFRLPDDASFTIEDQSPGGNGVVRKIYINFGDLKIEMPSVKMLHDRSLVYPRSVTDLITLREGLAEKLVDYDFLNTIADAEQRNRVAKTLFVGLARVGLSSKQ
jgi:hypothetical protein